MPSGYTADIAKDISFEQFALRCSRAFGVLVHMRDDPFDAPIPEEFKPEPFYLDRVEETKAKIAELSAMTPGQISDAAAIEYVEALERNAGYIQEAVDLKAKYKAMLAKAIEWVPPSSEHEGLKKFMIEQIHQSIDHDCDFTYWEEHKPEKKSPAVWHAEALAAAHSSLASSQKSLAEEIKRCEFRNLWIRQLRESLK